MRLIFLLLALVTSYSANAGALPEQFSLGFGSVAWHTPLAQVVTFHPEGDHIFAVGPGERLYSIPSQEPLFGLPRSRMRAEYGFDPGSGRMRLVQIYFPYESREKLLGMLTLSFGPYQKMEVKGISTSYYWLDNGTFMAVRASLDPAFGILQLTVSKPLEHPVDKKPPAPGCESSQ
jgi:hypothetical protein